MFSLESPTYVDFVISNESDQEFFLDNNPYGFFFNGSHLGGFQIYAKKENGEILNSIYGQRGLIASGRFGIKKINPYQSLTIRILLSNHLDIKTPGKYELFVTKKNERTTK